MSKYNLCNTNTIAILLQKDNYVILLLANSNNPVKTKWLFNVWDSPYSNYKMLNYTYIDFYLYVQSNNVHHN